jgi:hypothetical protein
MRRLSHADGRGRRSRGCTVSSFRIRDRTVKRFHRIGSGLHACSLKASTLLTLREAKALLDEMGL